MGLKVMDGIFKNRITAGIKKPVFCERPPFSTKNILMRRAVGGVVTGNTMEIPFDFGK